MDGYGLRHIPLVLPRRKMDTPDGLFAGGCVCGWRSMGLENEFRARRSAEQHCQHWNTLESELTNVETIDPDPGYL